MKLAATATDILSSPTAVPDIVKIQIRIKTRVVILFIGNIILRKVSYVCVINSIQSDKKHPAPSAGCFHLLYFFDRHGTGLILGRLRYRVVCRIGEPVGVAFAEMEGHPDQTLGDLSGHTGPDRDFAATRLHFD